MSHPLPSLAKVARAETLEEVKDAVAEFGSDIVDVLASVPLTERKTLYFQTQDLPTRVYTTLDQAIGAAVLSFRQAENETAAYNIGALNIVRTDDEEGGLWLGAVDTTLSGLSANVTYVAELLIVGERGT